MRYRSSGCNTCGAAWATPAIKPVRAMVSKLRMKVTSILKCFSSVYRAGNPLFVMIVDLHTGGARLRTDAREGGLRGERYAAIVADVVGVEHDAPVCRGYQGKAGACGGDGVALGDHGRKARTARHRSGRLQRGVARRSRDLSRPAGAAEWEIVGGEGAGGDRRGVVDARSVREQELSAREHGGILAEPVPAQVQTQRQAGQGPHGNREIDAQAARRLSVDAGDDEGGAAGDGDAQGLLDVLPLHIIKSGVEAHAVVPEVALAADFVVGQLVGLHRNEVGRDQLHQFALREAAAEALRIAGVHGVVVAPGTATNTAG